MRWWIWFRGWLKNQKQMEALPEKKAEEQKSFFLYMRMAPEILTRMRRERGIPLKELELVLIDNENEPVWQVQAILETLVPGLNMLYLVTEREEQFEEQAEELFDSQDGVAMTKPEQKTPQGT
ncbi:MAG: hypothetical protein ACLRTA_08935 [Clostridia bacterium]